LWTATVRARSLAAALSHSIGGGACPGAGCFGVRWACACAGVGVRDLVKMQVSISEEEFRDLCLGMGTTIGEKSEFRKDGTPCN
jgi:hypothetical protein